MMTPVTFAFTDQEGSPHTQTVEVTDGDPEKPLVVLVHGLSGTRFDLSDPGTNPGVQRMAFGPTRHLEKRLYWKEGHESGNLPRETVTPSHLKAQLRDMISFSQPSASFLESSH